MQNWNIEIKKTDTFDYITMLICCKAKDAISKVNRQTINYEKNICDAEDKGYHL